MKKYYLFLTYLLAIMIFNSCSEEHNVYLCQIVSPESIRNGEEFEVRFGVGEDSEVKSVVFWMYSETSFTDGLEMIQIGEVKQYPFSVKYTPHDMAAGKYYISAEVESNGSKVAYTSLPASVDLKLNLGDMYQGGTIFSLDIEGKHGLIASDRDMVGIDRTWFIWGPTDGLGVSNSDGMVNTSLLAGKSDSESEMGYWFKGGFKYNDFEDWYIPSLEEGKLLQKNKQYLKNIKSHFYWTSSEMSGEYADIAYIIDFSNNVTEGNMGQKKNKENLVRLIRKF